MSSIKCIRDMTFSKLLMLYSSRTMPSHMSLEMLKLTLVHSNYDWLLMGYGQLKTSPPTSYSKKHQWIMDMCTSSLVGHIPWKEQRPVSFNAMMYSSYYCTPWSFTKYRYVLHIGHSWVSQKIRKERGNTYGKNKEISRQKAHTNPWKLNWNISTITDVFLD